MAGIVNQEFAFPPTHNPLPQIIKHFIFFTTSPQIVDQANPKAYLGSIDSESDDCGEEEDDRDKC